jgi:hypothetical protein
MTAAPSMFRSNSCNNCCSFRITLRVAAKFNGDSSTLYDVAVRHQPTMISFGNEAMVCIGTAAVDGSVAVAAADRRRTSGVHSACVLPPQWRASLHAVAGHDRGRLRNPGLGPSLFLPDVEAGRKPCGRRCYRNHSRASFSTGICRRRHQPRPLLLPRTSRPITLGARSSSFSFLHFQVPGLVLPKFSIQSQCSMDRKFDCAGLSDCASRF